MGLEDPKSGSRGHLWGRRTSDGSGGPQVRFYGAGGPPTGLEDLQWIWRTSDGSGGPPMDLEDPKSGSMGLEDIYGGEGPPTALQVL